MCVLCPARVEPGKQPEFPSPVTQNPFLKGRECCYLLKEVSPPEGVRDSRLD